MLLLCLVLALVVLLLLNIPSTRALTISWLPLIVLVIVWLVALPLAQKSQMDGYFAKLSAVNERCHAENEAIIQLLTEIRDQRRPNPSPPPPVQEPASTPAGNPWAT